MTASSPTPRAGAPRSFVRRAGRITPAQRRALEALSPRYRVSADHPLDFEAVFGRRAPRVLEIGFGAGEALIDSARRHRERDHLGIDVHAPGIGRVMLEAARLELDNLRVIEGDAAGVLPRCFADASLDAIHVFFPDPWPKKRHHKRRLIQAGFVAELVRCLVPGGRLALATDWEDYAWHMLEVLESEPRLVNVAGPGCFAPRYPDRPSTRFERRGLRLGHEVRDLLFENRGEAG